MNELKRAALAVISMVALLSSCASYNAYERAKTAEQVKNWDTAVEQYEKALEIDPDNTRYRIGLERARLEASRKHFEKGRTLRAAANAATGDEQMRLMQLAATELQITVKLDSSNQYAAVELGKALSFLQDVQRAAMERTSIDEIKRRVSKEGITKAQPPVLNPASSEPISLSFPRETPVKDIYRALGNAFGINILFDQAVKDDRITIELRDVTAQQALERVMQAANHFYKVLDPKTIIIVPDNPQARRDYEDLVIQTFYLSNGDAEQVTNVVRTMIEARNVFPLKALNAITIRDTADKVRIAQKIIEANDKAKAEVVVGVELVQLDLTKLRDIGFAIQGPAEGGGQIIANGSVTDTAGKTTSGPLTGQVYLSQLRSLGPGSFSFSMPTASYSLTKSITNAELLASPELRISEGEKATLHIGNRIPVPVSTFTAISTGTSPYQPVVSYQYQDVGIKVSIEPRVHHNQEVTLKLTVEVSNQGPDAPGVQGQAPQPTFVTRTIESTIRLKDGETNFLAGLIQDTKTEGSSKTPFLGDIPILGRLFTRDQRGQLRTDLELTMTPHIVRMPDITEDDIAPMWVGTQNNLTFRGVSPRMESMTQFDPFTPAPPAGRTGYSPRANPAVVNTPGGDVQGNVPVNPQPGFVPPQGTAPANPFAPPPKPQGDASGARAPSPVQSTKLVATAESAPVMSDEAALRLAPRISPQPATLTMKAGQKKTWTVVGMDLDGLTTDHLSFRYDPHSLDVEDVMFGPAINIDPKAPPAVTINRELGIVNITSSNAQPLSFNSGGELLQLKLQGIMTGDAALVLDAPELKNGKGQVVLGAISGGRAKVE